jgi:hypothetical protein
VEESLQECKNLAEVQRAASALQQFSDLDAKELLQVSVLTEIIERRAMHQFRPQVAT